MSQNRPVVLLSEISGKNADNAATNDSTGVELGRCRPLNGFAQLRELSFPIYVTSSRSANELVDCGGADLALNFLSAVQHRKPERHSLVVVPQNLACISGIGIVTRYPLISRNRNSR